MHVGFIQYSDCVPPATVCLKCIIYNTASVHPHAIVSLNIWFIYYSDCVPPAIVRLSVFFIIQRLFSPNPLCVCTLVLSTAAARWRYGSWCRARLTVPLDAHPIPWPGSLMCLFHCTILLRHRTHGGRAQVDCARLERGLTLAGTVPQPFTARRR
jgi:hypothetical protein